MDKLDKNAVAGLSRDQKRELLKQMMAQRATAERASSDEPELSLPTIVPDPARRHEPFPLTEIQQAYWVGRKAAFDLGDVSIHFYVELDTGLDIDRLQHAWQQLVARHDMLRGVILPTGQQQILAEVPPYEFVREDLRGLEAHSREARLATLREDIEHDVFQLDRWPSFSIRACRLSDERYRLFVSIDMVNSDGGSMLLLMREWADFYDEPERPREPLALSYRDYVLAEESLRRTERYQRALAYWSEKIHRLPGAPELPLARSPGEITRTRFVHRTYSLPADSWRLLQQRIREAGLSPAVVLLGVYADVLATWSRSQRLTVNVTLFNRLPFHPQVDSIVGDFTSMILLGVDTGSAPAFVDRARNIQKELWASLEHRDVSGVRVLRMLAQARKSTTGGVMPVVYSNLFNLGSRKLVSLYRSLSRLGEIVHSITQTPQVWLDFQMHEEQHGGLTLNFDAVEELFLPGFLDAMLSAYAGQLLRLSEDAAAWTEPHTCLVPREQLEARARINTTEAPIPAETLRSLFVRRAERQPEATAVITPSRSLSYGDLLALSNRIGNVLQERAVGRDRLVGVVMDKGWEQMAAVLGIHAAGAAYLPIDPALPTARRNHLLAHGEVALVLTQPHHDQSLEWPASVQRLTLEDPAIRAAVARSPANPPRPGDLSHVIYTSGSTGQPKGVMVEHRQVVNRILDVNQRFEIGGGDRAFGLTSLSHDLSVYDIFGLLAAGGAIVLPEAGRVRDPAHWLQLAQEHQVTLWNSVPAFAEMLVTHVALSAGEPARLPSLRLMILAGDWIPVSLPDRVRSLAQNVRFMASGGPTETTIWDILYPVGRVDPSWRSIPYGKPLTNARYHVLNELLQPCPVWVPGELYIGGACLTRGYWRDEALTQARFITHPETGERLYRSGDMGRWLPDGNLEFMGRSDFQVKIGGYRIELGEIESALRQHPAVSEVITIAHGERGHQRLVSYVVPSPEYRPALVAGPHSPAPGAAAGKAGAEADTDFFPGATLLDPAERMAFKLREQGPRPLGDERTLELPGYVEDRAFERRRSERSFAAEPVALGGWGALLAHLARREMGAQKRYRYPSGGSLYPVQVYIHVRDGRVAGVPGGAYYYDPRGHRLVRISDGSRNTRAVHAVVNRDIFDQAAFCLYLVGKMSAVEPLYGELARDFCLLEAGYMSQLLMDAAADSGLGLCPVAGTNFEAVRDDFRVGADHVFLHALLGGTPRPEQPVAAPDTRPLSQVLRDFLAERLPEQMVPATYVMLGALPRSANGKIERQLLPEPEPTGGQADAGQEAFVAPSSEVERACAAIVCEVLGIDRVGVNDNFFELGGNSIFVVRIHGRLKQVFGRDISIVDLFRNPRISFVAQLLSGKENGTQRRVSKAAERGQARREASAASRPAKGVRSEQPRRAGRDDRDGHNE